MKLTPELWDIKGLLDNKDAINPKPQYQRTPVWTEERKAYLIDSILRGYDLPKFYMLYHKSGQPYEYEVADGQQRMRAIWEFMEDAYPLKKNTIIEQIDLSGLYFSELSKKLQTHFIKFEINICMVLECQPGEINELFTRLQKGVTLNPPELRHAMYSELAFYTSSFLERKRIRDFFNDSAIKDSRFKNQDYIDHVVALVYFNNKRDLKAAAMLQLYSDFAEAKISTFKSYFDNAEKVIEKMTEINSFKKGVFKNKWAFVDYFWFLYKLGSKINTVDSEKFSEKIVEFEEERLAYNATPEKLLVSKKVKFGRDMYDYIQAFNKEGANKDNVTTRNTVLSKIFKGI